MRGLLASGLRPYRGFVAIVVLLQLVSSLANLTLPDLNADIINDGIAKGDTDVIISIGAVMLLVTAVLAVTSIVAVYFGSRVAMGFGRDLRSSIFRTVEGFAQQEVNRFGTPSLITRNTNDVQQVQTLVLLMLNMMIAAPIMAVGGIIMALRMDVPLSALLLVILPILVLIVGLVMSRALPLFRVMQVKVDRLNQVMRESLAGVRVIRAFVRTDHEERRFDRASRDLADTALHVSRLFAITIPAIMLVFNLSTVGVMWFGSQRVASGEMPIGNLVAFLAYLMQILWSVMMAVFLLVMVPRAAASSERIVEVLGTQPSVTDPVSAAAPPPTRGEITFEDVEFRYPGAEDPVLRGITITLRPAEVTAIVGSTGSGKSTLLSLIPRFYDVTSGRVLVDGVDIRDMRRDDLWRGIGLVPQRAFLFSGSVARNLRFGDPDATDEALWEALEIAQASDFVTEMEGGLEAPITQGGSNVSGGQRQRLAIARALVKRPLVYLFDDSFSALDARTDARLRAALRASTAHATVVIVAQRVGTIIDADRIIVMDSGTVVGVGTHRELLETNETYREIVSSQLSAAEAA